MKTIWKFPLEFTDEQDIEVPIGWKPLSVQIQVGRLNLWAEVDDEYRTQIQTIRIFGTGHPIDTDGYTFFDTVQLDGLVWHIYV